MAIIFGLTGGIASGKSTLATYLEEEGVEMIDADLIAREVVAPGTEGLNQIVEHFGSDMLNAHGALNRQAMRAHIFHHPTERQWLENLTHPMIRQRIQSRIDASTSEKVCLVIPLLKSRDDYPMIETLIVVDVDESIQIARLIERDNIDELLAKKMIASQLPRAKRNAMADILIENNGDQALLKAQIKKALD